MFLSVLYIFNGKLNFSRVFMFMVRPYIPMHGGILHKINSTLPVTFTWFLEIPLIWVLMSNFYIMKHKGLIINVDQSNGHKWFLIGINNYRLLDSSYTNNKTLNYWRHGIFYSFVRLHWRHVLILWIALNLLNFCINFSYKLTLIPIKLKEIQTTRFPLTTYLFPKSYGPSLGLSS